MIEKEKIYRCEKCGNIIESLWNGKPSIICCGEPMTELKANTVDASKEKHVPVIERTGTQVKVKVGSAPHPMEKDHYILFVEVLKGNDVYRHDFVEGDTVAEAMFTIPDDGTPLQAREFCNKHGLWATA
ncbi:MAG: desulfoferrodoxin [Spirochaetota bacterium]